ncbi:hypothetical protein [Amycolatopsis granulosa]|uniref:hypothetical protein n=1 Tax=Amycolatopsis granulosa TaxID=185684 RepID=UPI00141D7FBE|nr:hypothetical protein [Amycolatopsis granulosa]NIH83903.1 Zn-dependent protease [Amycolatopsis granulosa]
MTLSDEQRRELAEIERDLCTEPTLPTLTELFAGSPHHVSSWAAQPRTRTVRAGRRTRLVTPAAAAAAVLGIADAIVAGLAGLTTPVSIGVVVAVSAVAVLVADLLCPDRSAGTHLPNPFHRG